MSFYIDHDQLNKFISILPILNSDEAYFLCLCSRNKYLKDNQKLEVGSLSSRVLSQVLITDNNWEKAIAKAYSCLLYKKTKNGLEIPENTVVCFASINPVSLIKGTSDFIQKALNSLTNLAVSSINKDKNHLELLKNPEKVLIGSIVSSTSRKYYLDLDIDILNKNFDKYLDFFNQLKINKINYHIIETINGFHCLINKNDLKNLAIDFHSILSEFISRASRNEDSVSISKSNLVPLPGTLQNGHLVSFI